MKTSELTGVALDWAVAKAGGGAKDISVFLDGHSRLDMYRYSTDWSQGGPIIEMDGIELVCNLTPAEAARFKAKPHWRASRRAWAKGDIWYGPAPLIAAMRCYVASYLGDAVDIPQELTNDNS